MISTIKSNNNMNKLYPTASITLVDRTNYLQITAKPTNKPKKGLSVQSKSHSKRRKQDIVRIYKTLSQQKHEAYHSKNASRSPSKKNGDYHQYFPCYQKTMKTYQSSIINLNQKQSKRLSLTMSNKSLNSKIAQNLLNKLEQIYKCNLDKIFLSLYQTLSQQIRNNQKQYFLLSKIIQMIENCQIRKHQIFQQQLKQKFALGEQNRNRLSVEIQKNKIKNEILTKTLDDSHITIQQLRRIIRVMESKKSDCKSIGVYAQIKDIQKALNHQYVQTLPLTQSNKSNSQNQFIGNSTIQADEYLSKIKQYQKRQEQFISVLCQLKKQGANIEKAYRKIAKHEHQDSQQDSSVQIQQCKFKNVKKKSQKLKIVEYQCSEEADQSIVSQMEAMNFDYEDKSVQEYVFTDRRIYKCQKQLDQGLKQQLMLKIGQLYESQQQNNSLYNPTTV